MLCRTFRSEALLDLTLNKLFLLTDIQFLFTFFFQHTSSESFSIALSDVLKMIFINDQVYLSLHWTGDADFDDTRIWIQTVVHREKGPSINDVTP